MKVYQIQGGYRIGVEKYAKPVRKRYVNDFTQSIEPWLSYWSKCGIGMPAIFMHANHALSSQTRKHYIFSQGPWWIDPNHACPGYGYLHLIFFAFTSLEAFNYMNTIFPFFNDNLAYPLIDGMIIKGTLKGVNVELKGSNLYFWIQVYSSKYDKLINFIYSQKPLSIYLDGNVNNFSLHIDINESNWTCLGSCKEKEDIYGYCNIQDISGDPIYNMGFILAPIDVKLMYEEDIPAYSSDNIYNFKGPIDMSRLPTGIIMMHYIQIEYFQSHRIILLS